MDENERVTAFDQHVSANESLVRHRTGYDGNWREIEISLQWEIGTFLVANHKLREDLGQEVYKIPETSSAQFERYRQEMILTIISTRIREGEFQISDMDWKERILDVIRMCLVTKKPFTQSSYVPPFSNAHYWGE